MSTPEQRLADLGIKLPEPLKPVANFVPFVQTGNLLFISGQVAAGPDGRITGRLGEDMDLDGGYSAARYCGINLIAQCKSALGDLAKITRVVKLGGFVNAAPDFVDIPKVINGCSDLMVDVFADVGRHARFAVGASSLPGGVAVEVDGVFEIAID